MLLAFFRGGIFFRYVQRMLRTATDSCALLMFAMLSTFQTSSSANTTYNYSGFGVYTAFCNGTYGQTPNCSGAVTGEFSLPGTGLSSNVDNVLISPIAFSFTDHVGVTLKSSDAIGYARFTVTTDSTGELIAWSVTLDVNNTANHTCSDNNISNGKVLQIYGSIFNGQYGEASCYNVPSTQTFGAGANSFSNLTVVPQVWTSTTAVPEPSTALLFSVALLPIVLVLRRRRSSAFSRAQQNYSGCEA